ncbi:MAG: hypothetical protein K0R57_3097 [Paenibacillaceae bacterium]|nr:hypothetical protein [Paenibacillaceae bacterium]
MKQPAKRVPIYLQIRQYLIGQIRQGFWKAGDRLPSENELAHTFQGSRITVKQALTALVEEGAVYRVQGKGSFVAEGAAELLQGISGESQGSGLPPSAQSAQSAYSILSSPSLPGGPSLMEAGLSAPPLIAFIIQNTLGSICSDLLLGIEEAATDGGCRVLFMNARDSRERESAMLQEAVQSGAKGIILFPVHGETYNEEVLRLTMEHYPIVVLDRYLRGVETNCVCSDNHKGTYLAVSHLIGKGHRRIGCVSSPVLGTTSLEDRLHGYEQALADHGIPVDHAAMLFNPAPEAIADFLHTRTALTALVAFDSVHGGMVMKAAEQAGIRIPEDLSLVAFDDYPFAELFKVLPTVIVQPFREIGQAAAQLLMELISSPGAERRRVTLPVQLIERSSTGPLPTRSRRE